MTCYIIYMLRFHLLYLLKFVETFSFSCRLFFSFTSKCMEVFSDCSAYQHTTGCHPSMAGGHEDSFLQGQAGFLAPDQQGNPSNSVIELSSGGKCLCVVPIVCVKVFGELPPQLPGDHGGISHPKTTVTSEIVIIQNPFVSDSRPIVFFSLRDFAS